VSVVACRILKDGFEMSADSICVYGYTQTKGENTKHAKLVEVNNIVIGGVGWSQDNSLMQLFAETHSIIRPDERGILEFLSEFSDWKKEKIDDAKINNQYFIGFKGKVWEIYDWSIMEVKKYSAIGAGMDFALAALYFGAPTSKAVEVATELSIFCEKPIVTIRK